MKEGVFAGVCKSRAANSAALMFGCKVGLFLTSSISVCKGKDSQTSSIVRTALFKILKSSVH